MLSISPARQGVNEGLCYSLARAFGPRGFASYFSNSRVCRLSIGSACQRSTPAHLRRDLERVAVDDDDVGRPAGLDRAHEVGDAEDLRGIERDRLQRLLLGRPNAAAIAAT